MKTANKTYVQFYTSYGLPGSKHYCIASYNSITGAITYLKDIF